MSNTPTRMAVDGKWIDCLPNDEYGVLGVRYTFDLGHADGQPVKRLLIRPRALPATGDRPAKLVVSTTPAGRRFSLRPAAKKAYQETTGQGGREPCKVLQQDVTGLVTLGQAVHRAVKEGNTSQVWTLFYTACEALREFGAAGPGKLVPLQCPPSLAVAPDGSVVLLDAEIRAAGSLPDDSPIRRAYGAWFGSEGHNGFADANRASLLHSRAVLSYFLSLLRSTPLPTTLAARSAHVKVATKMALAPADADLHDLEGWIRDNAEDWSLPIEDGLPSADEDDVRRRPTTRNTPPAPQQGIRVEPTGQPPEVNVELAGRPPLVPRKKRSLLLWASLLINLLLLLLLLLMWLGWPKPVTGQNAAADPSSATGDVGALTFSSYCVVFPTQGTISEKVDASLADLFPGKAEEIKRSSEDHRRRLNQKLDDSIKSLKDPEKLKKLLVSLSADHSIRFKGFVASEPSDTLPALIERGGIFTIAGGTKEQYGSLLQTDGLDRVLKESAMEAQQEPKALLQSLKSAVADYASLEDALNIINDRPAFLLRVEPTAAGHETVRKKLLGRADKPVFISRPIPELFDAVDPTADTGGGAAAYTLRLDRKCFWRLAGLDDRKNVDFAANASNDQMKWQAFEPGHLISWKPIPLTKKSGRTDSVETFDIAVVLDSKVVVFRNQSIQPGKTRDEVVRNCQRYIESGFGVRVPTPDDAISVNPQDQQFTGTLKYSYLADQVAATAAGDDLQILKAAEFDTQRMTEDKPLGK